MAAPGNGGPWEWRPDTANLGILSMKHAVVCMIQSRRPARKPTLSQ